jgi:hypothetical protein
MNQTNLSPIAGLLVKFSPLFSNPSFGNFTALVTGWILCVGRRTISRVIQFGGFSTEQRRHHSVFYRFFTRAKWQAEGLGERLFELVLPLIPEGWGILLLVDDTLCRKSGAHIWGAGMHHDPLLSNYGRGKTLVKFFSFGHNWVILCVCIPLPWNQEKGIAIPIAFRLYRSKKQCPVQQYKKRTELAHEMVNQVAAWVPPHRKIHLIGDTEYACRNVVHGLPKRIVFVGPIHMGAAVYDEPKQSTGRGRPRKKGQRLLSPKQLVEADHLPWEQRTVVLYGRQVEVLFKTQVCLWYHVAGSRLVRMIVTRDPKGRIEDRAYFSTDAEMSIDAVARTFSHRWSQEEMHHNVKQHLGLEDPQNGWWRRPAGQRKDPRVPGPRPHETRGEEAANRTVPFILTIYALVVLWYFANGSVSEDVERVRQRAPWYQHKTTPSFGDMLAALRRHLWRQHNFDQPAPDEGSAIIYEKLEDLLCAA